MTENSLLEQLRSKFDKKCQLTNKIVREGCKISLENAPKSRLVINLDKLPLSNNQFLCDFLFFADEDVSRFMVVLLELKRGKLHAARTHKQLKGGADMLQSYIPKHSKFALYAIVAVGGAVSKLERRNLRLKSNRIKLHHQSCFVSVMRCGDRLMAQIK